MFQAIFLIERIRDIVKEESRELNIPSFYKKTTLPKQRIPLHALYNAILRDVQKVDMKSFECKSCLKLSVQLRLVIKCLMKV